MFDKIISIRQKFTVSMVYILLFELIIFAMFVCFGGTLGTIVSNVYGNLKETTVIRTNSLADSLNSVSDLADNSYNEINNVVSQQEYASAGYDEAFITLLPRLQYMTTNQDITGAFVVMGADLTVDRLPAIYLRDHDKSMRGQSYCLNISSENIINRTGILRAQNWSTSLNIKESESLDYLSEPIRLAAENPGVESTALGYWSMPYQINFDGQRAVAYTLPLKNTNGECIGVFGVEVSLSHIKDSLPYLEINSKGMGSYVLLCKNNSDSDFTRVAVSGSTFDKLNNYSDKVSFSSGAVNNGMYTLNTSKKQRTKVYSTINEVNLWDSCGYEHKTWLLCGVVDSVYLNDLENGIRFNVLFAFAITMFLGLIFAWIVSRLMAEPIHKFIGEIKTIRADNPVIPSQSNISEINELAKVVESLTDDLTDFSAKVSTIIDLAGLNFGAFEYDKNSDFVYCTDMLYTLLNMEKPSDKLFVPRQVFEEKMGMFCKEISPDINKVYKMKLPGGGIKFVHIKTAVNNNKILGVIQDTTQAMVTERSRQLTQDHDSMTNLLNRTAFRRNLSNIFAGSAEKPKIAVLLHCNIDKMSDVNVRYGSTIGDKYIYSIAAIFRKSADRITSFAARTAGDEFKYLLLGTDKKAMEKQLDELIKGIYDTKIYTADGTLAMRASIGAAWYPQDTESSSMLEQYAEFAMRQVKRSGRNAFKYFDKAAFEESERNIRSSRNIEMLISEGLIRYAFQPIVDARTGNIYGYEALMRPDSTNAITPHDVIVFATEQNKLNIIERITWFTALEDFSIQVDPLLGRKMFVNSIPSQLLSDEDFAELENKYGEYLSNIVLEIIENEQTDPEIISKKKGLVEKWGCLLALDDYGSGYANDNTLLSLKPDVIKLDIEMITGIEDDKDRQTLVKNIIDYAHQRKIMVLAEGIETHTQMETLITYGVDLMQGFYLAKPNFDAVDSIDEKIINEILDIRNK